MNCQDDINDIFSSIACSEESINKKGYEEGFQAGKNDGWKDGNHLGYHKGAETGSQIGYYAGFVNQLIKSEGKLKELNLYNKVEPTVLKLKQLTDEFPRSNDPSVDIIKILEECRTVFKKLCALLKLQFDLPEAKFITY